MNPGHDDHGTSVGFLVVPHRMGLVSETENRWFFPKNGLFWAWSVKVRGQYGNFDRINLLDIRPAKVLQLEIANQQLIIEPLVGVLVNKAEEFDEILSNI